MFPQCFSGHEGSLDEEVTVALYNCDHTVDLEKVKPLFEG
jgi:hypothetical protein